MNDDKVIAAAVTSFFTGAILGAGLALLFAPKSGQELREDISESADKAVEKIKTATNEGKALLNEKASVLSGLLKKPESAA